MKEKRTENFENLITKLEKTVDELEEKDISLENSIKKFEEGIILGKICLEKLKEAEDRVRILVDENKDKFVFEKFEEK